MCVLVWLFVDWFFSDSLLPKQDPQRAIIGKT